MRGDAVGAAQTVAVPGWGAGRGGEWVRVMLVFHGEPGGPVVRLLASAFCLLSYG